MTSIETWRTVDRGTAFLPPAEAPDLLAEALSCIIGGRPLPAALRPETVTPPAPASVQEGIERILAGRAARPPDP